MATAYQSRPARLSDVRFGDALHNDCGGRIEQEVYAGGYSFHAGPYQCAKCKRKWSDDTIEKRFTAHDIADRFHVRVLPQEQLDEMALCWVDDPLSKTRITKLVPLWQARGLERVKV